jgi:hypothetical protein
MKPIEDLDRDEKNLLLYFETVAVDSYGKVDTRRMNAIDHSIANDWHQEGFVEFSRIQTRFIKGCGTHCVKLSDKAWEYVSELRKTRANNMWARRDFKTTREESA